ncbi:MAG: gas vesicle protein GvpH [Candidatus Brocadiia bacterium]|jgi:HSP20 family protein
MGSSGIVDRLGTILEKLSELAESGKELHETKDIRDPATGQTRGVVGYSIRVGIGNEGIKVERFGNLRKDEKTGKAVVHPVREPLVDLFDEADHVLVLVEMPGMGSGDVQLELRDDILTIAAEKGDQKYRKEVLLPSAFLPANMSHTCRNGILEVKFMKDAPKR